MRDYIFIEKYGKLLLNYPCYPLLSEAMFSSSAFIPCHSFLCVFFYFENVSLRMYVIVQSLINLHS